MTLICGDAPFDELRELLDLTSLAWPKFGSDDRR